jgi:hypothetical protein
MKITDHHGLHLVHVLSALAPAAGRPEADLSGNVYLHLTKVILKYDHFSIPLSGK